MTNAGRCAVGLAVAIVSCTPAQAPTWPRPASCAPVARTFTPARGSVDVLLIASGRPCAEGLEDLRESLARGAVAVKKHLREVGFSHVRLVREPPAEKLLERLREPRARPLLMVYTGHGLLHDAPSSPLPRAPESTATFDACSELGAPCVSAICADGELIDVDALVAAVAPERRFAFLVVDACSSAHVDVRRARTRLSVSSAASTRQATGADGFGFLTEALARLDVHAADRDCNGELTDVELFDWLKDEVPRSRRMGVVPPNPKLRRQAEGPGVLARVAGAGNRACTPRPIAGMSGDRVEDRWLHPRHRRFLGCVPPDVISSEVKHGNRREARIPMPCTDDIGQCFRFEE